MNDYAHKNWRNAALPILIRYRILEIAHWRWSLQFELQSEASLLAGMILSTK